MITGLFSLRTSRRDFDELSRVAAKAAVARVGAARQIRIAGCSQNESLKLVALIESLEMLVSHVSKLVSRQNLLPQEGSEEKKLNRRQAKVGSCKA
jgi:hypothetical protein